jgi:hypothetical protein
MGTGLNAGCREVVESSGKGCFDVGGKRRETASIWTSLEKKKIKA